MSKPITTDAIRAAFLEFFRQRDHRIVPSDSLVPTNDPSLLFTGAGMNQFKDEFLGKGDPALKRAVTCQKCLRVPDVENVGRTPDHHTFFEMLGNFSFGDYFKKEAILWAWEFSLEVMKLDRERLFVSVHEKDGESFDIWRNVVGLPENKIYHYGDDENFWPANAPAEGPNGPCGPCSEIYFDTGRGCGRSSCEPRCKCRRFVEFWNLVFTQFDRQGPNVLQPLAQTNIDTGMGLERMARVMQGVQTNFEIDIFVPIIQEIERLCGGQRERSAEHIARMRRIADHVRAVIFCLSDGVLFSNEGRGYVIRRLLRRAVRDGRELGQHDAFLHRLVPTVARVMHTQYPELVERQDNLARYIRTEEERFHQTLEQGMSLLAERIEELQRRRQTVLPGEQAFQLYDTYGFPLDLTELILQERGLGVDKAGFNACMERQREQARRARGVVSIFDTGPLGRLKEFAPTTEFVGYERTEDDARIIAIISGDELVESASEGEEVQVLLDRTPFYGESGGQVGDTGRLFGPGFEVQVTDALSVEGYHLHVGKVTRGRLQANEAVHAAVDAERREAIRRNHTVTHILHHVLREVLGKHVEQSGSLVAPDRMRFDYSHPQAPSREELERIEDRVNELILQDDPVSVRMTSLQEAKKAGAMALFTEKYGEEVRVVSIGQYSSELCGGTHLDRTGKIGVFRIIAEGSIAAGFRRIEAITGTSALAEVRRRDRILERLCQTLQTASEQLVERAEALLNENRELRRQLKERQKKEVFSTAENLLSEVQAVGGLKMLVKQMPDGTSVEELRTALDVLRKAEPLLIAVLASATGDGRCHLVCGATEGVVARGLSAGEVVKEVARYIEGGGGGRPDLAQAGGKNPAGIPAALERAREIICSKL